MVASSSSSRPAVRRRKRKARKGVVLDIYSNYSSTGWSICLAGSLSESVLLLSSFSPTPWMIQCWHYCLEAAGMPGWQCTNTICCRAIRCAYFLLQPTSYGVQLRPSATALRLRYVGSRNTATVHMWHHFSAQTWAIKSRDMFADDCCQQLRYKPVEQNSKSLRVTATNLLVLHLEHRRLLYGVRTCTISITIHQVTTLAQTASVR